MDDVDGVSRVKKEGEGISLAKVGHVSTSDGFGGFILKTIEGFGGFGQKTIGRRFACLGLKTRRGQFGGLSLKTTR
jgi:hypothetical protein